MKMMKLIVYIGKAFFLTIVLLFSARFTFAQTQVGLRLGTNMSGVTGGAIHESIKTGIGYNAGFFYRISLGGIKLQPELVVSSRNFGFSHNVDTTGLKTSLSERKVKSTYLDVPLLLVVDLAKNFSLLVGPQLSIKMSDKQVITGDPLGEVYQLNTFDAGVAAGASYMFPGGIDITFRGFFGLMPIYEKDNPNLGGEQYPDIRNIQLQFTVGLPISTSITEEVDRSSYKTIY